MLLHNKYTCVLVDDSRKTDTKNSHVLLSYNNSHRNINLQINMNLHILYVERTNAVFINVYFSVLVFLPQL
jgi:hypothetical protein